MIWFPLFIILWELKRILKIFQASIQKSKVVSGNDKQESYHLILCRLWQVFSCVAAFIAYLHRAIRECTTRLITMSKINNCIALVDVSWHNNFQLRKPLKENNLSILTILPFLITNRITERLPSAALETETLVQNPIRK